jgi:hypothetical protein
MCIADCVYNTHYPNCDTLLERQTAIFVAVEQGVLYARQNFVYSDGIQKGTLVCACVALLAPKLSYIDHSVQHAAPG